jgi:hypothetical protein
VADIPSQEKLQQMLKENLELVNEINKQSEIGGVKEAQKYTSAISFLTKIKSVKKESLEIINKEISATDDEKKEEHLKRQLEMTENILAAKRNLANAEAKIGKALDASQEKYKQANEKVNAFLKGSTERAIESARNATSASEANVLEFGGVVETVFDTVVKGADTALGFISLAADSPEFLLLAGAMEKLGLDTGVSVNAIMTKLQAMPGQLDESFRNVVKTTGQYSKTMHESFLYAISPLEGIRDKGLFPPGTEMPLIGIGISAAESGQALQSVLDNVSLFRPKFMEANKSTTAFTVNLMAGMKKIGISTETSSKTLDKFTRAMKFTPKQATDSVKSLINVADSLGINAGKAVEDFNNTLPVLSQYGDRAIEVFADLEAQSVATGVAVSDLSEFAKGLDTFSGAAEAAQGFNAVMGATLLDVNALVHADPADKIGMIQEAMDGAGISFEDADRRVKQVIASTLNMDVERAGRILGGKEDFEELAAGVDTAAMSQKDLEQRVNDSMTSAEQLTKSVSLMAGGMQKFVDTSRVAAVKGANSITDAFTGTRDVLGDSMTSAMGIVSGLKMITNAATDVKTAFGRGGPAGTLFGTLEALGQTAGIATVGGAAGAAGNVQENVEEEGFFEGLWESIKDGFNVIGDAFSDEGTLIEQTKQQTELLRQIAEKTGVDVATPPGRGDTERDLKP